MQTTRRSLALLLRSLRFEVLRSIRLISSRGMITGEETPGAEGPEACVARTGQPCLPDSGWWMVDGGRGAVASGRGVVDSGGGRWQQGRALTEDLRGAAPPGRRKGQVQTPPDSLLAAHFLPGPLTRLPALSVPQTVGSDHGDVTGLQNFNNGSENKFTMKMQSSPALYRQGEVTSLQVQPLRRRSSCLSAPPHQGSARRPGSSTARNHRPTAPGTATGWKGRPACVQSPHTDPSP
ncbi:uncharacterized protein LOC125753509 [Canis lupus dingo]|uniref:uncharacterized protein LOC125753509 n=1 Tax=Canis lupus dingo TaxID=286419 RepID=UPI0020C232EE|nr:uncharacterized protein LOC125753509 [Canis lupus dingo]